MRPRIIATSGLSHLHLTMLQWLKVEFCAFLKVSFLRGLHIEDFHCNQQFKVVTRFMDLFQAFVNVQFVPRYMY